MPVTVQNEPLYEPEELSVAPARAELQDSDRKAKFEEIYVSNEWGSDESHSGKGSTLKYTGKFAFNLRVGN